MKLHCCFLGFEENLKSDNAIKMLPLQTWQDESEIQEAQRTHFSISPELLLEENTVSLEIPRDVSTQGTSRIPSERVR